MKNIPLPTEKISPKAVMVWRIRDALFHVTSLLLLGVLLFVANYYEWFYWAHILLYIVIGFTLLQTIYKLTLYPILLQRTWRYRVDEEYIQIRYGFFYTSHTIIPMSRIEYVNTDQGPILRRFNLAKVTIGTITTALEIPEISVENAKALREKIVHYAQIETWNDSYE